MITHILNWWRWQQRKRDMTRLDAWRAIAAQTGRMPSGE